MADMDTKPVGHAVVERSATLLVALTIIVVAIGGLVEVVPLFRLQETITPVAGMRPYTPLEQLGRDIYTREGCYTCHSQQIRPFRDEVERYGHYSIAAESMYDHPFLWGSKRTGPDLARVGGKYSNAWHVAHLVNPRDVVPSSIMPGYVFLLDRDLDISDVQDRMRALRDVGVPYSGEMIVEAKNDIVAQATGEGAEAMSTRYAKTPVGDFDGQPDRLTEMDALIAYLQMLGTLVDFKNLPKAGAGE